MESNTRVITRNDIQVKQPNMYAVIMYNDDITTMDFVVEVLCKVFGKEPQEASRIMMEVHQAGYGVAGIFTYDIAVTKKVLATQMAAQKKFPLKLEVKSTGNES